MPATLPLDISLQIVPRPTIKLMGVKINTDMQTAMEDIKKLQNDIKPQISELISRKENASTYGISWDVDAKNHSFNYCVAVQPTVNSVLPDEFEEIVIPGGLYVECILPSHDDLYRLYNYLHYKWLPEQDKNVEISDSPFYELYPNSYLKEEPIKLYIPVVGV